MEAIIDSGSTLCFINGKIIEELKIFSQLEKEIKVKLLDQTFITINKSISIDFEIEDRKFHHRFYVYETMKYKIILGLDFLKKSNLSINFTNTCLLSKGGTDEPPIKVKLPLRIEETVIIKGKENVQFRKRIEKEVEIYRFFPNIENENKYKIQTTLLPTLTEFCLMRYKISNLNFSKISLPKSMLLGWIEQSVVSVEKEEKCYQSVAEENVVELKVFHKDPKLLQLLEEFQFIFATDIGELKRATNIKHVIDTAGHEPIRSVPYRTSEKEKQIIKKEVDKMLSNGIIRISESPWSSPVVIVPKKDGTIRFCIDYRKLNKITVKDSMPLPLIVDTLDALNNCQFFTKMDLKSGYWSISMDEESIPKTAFCCHMGLFEFLVLPFGLTNSPATFQRYLQSVLNDLLWKFCLVYIDDVIIYSSSIEDHIGHLKIILDRLAKHQLRLNPEKCEFATRTVGYLGHIVTPEGISPDPDKTKSIENFPKPKKVRDVRSFLGMSSYYRRFVEGYSKIARPMNNLLKKNQSFKWDNECQKCFDELKSRLISPPILAHFKPECPIILFTDASAYAMGAILSQIQDGKEVVISYNSKTLAERQSRYSISDRECLAIVWAVQKLRPYLYGAPFVIKTDSCCLCYIMSVKNPNGRLMRYSMFLQDYNFTVEYKSGATHTNVDCLSRNPIVESEDEEVEAECLLIEDINIVEEQAADRWCQQILIEIREKKNKKYLSGFKIENGILYKVIFAPNNEEKLLLCVPKSLRRKILEELHDSKLSGAHLGFLKTYTKIRDRFYWNRCERTVRQYVRNCISCQERKADVGLTKGSMQPIDYPTLPFQMCGMDIVGQLTETPRKKKYIIVFIDLCSKYMVAKALKNIRSETLANFFIKKIMVIFGAVEKILTDQARSFCSEFMEEVYKTTMAQHLVTTPYHPSTNGLSERAIRTIRSMMSHFIDETHSNWDLYLRYLVFAYNTSIQESTGETPYMLIHGFEARLPIDVSLKLPNQFKFVDKYKSSLTECRELIRKRVENAQAKQKNDYDARHFNTLFRVGDLVALHKTQREKGLSQKLFKNFKGPYQVVRRIGLVSYELRNPKFPRRKMKRAHISRLKKWSSGAIEGLDEDEIIEKPDSKSEDEDDSSISKRIKNVSAKDQASDDLIGKEQIREVSEKASDSGDDSEAQDFSDAKQNSEDLEYVTTKSNDDQTD